MIRKNVLVFGVSALVLLVAVFGVALNVPLVSGNGTIYIRADGSVFPSTANITSVDNVTYTFTGNIYDSIVVERHNIVVDGAGYTLQGTGSGIGINLTGRSNVTIKNMEIKAFRYGIKLDYSSNNSISGNNITANSSDGIWLYKSSNNSVYGNNITTNNGDGIWLSDSSSYNSVYGNNITTNNWHGIVLSYSSNYNRIYENNITNNRYGILLWDSSNYNSIVGNNITTNNEGGIWLFGCSNNSIYGNNITTNNWHGIRLEWSSNNILRSNSMANNKYNFLVRGEGLSHFVNDVDASNTVEGKLIYYWVNERDRAVPLDAGYVALVNCTRITVQNLNLTKNGQGVLLVYTKNSTITKNNIGNNWYGIRLEWSSNNILRSNSIYGNNITIEYWERHCIALHNSSNNSIYGNNITTSNDGIQLDGSSNYNSIYENNIVNDEVGIGLYGSSNYNRIYGNNITNNMWAINVYTSSNSIHGNNVTDNYTGIWLLNNSNYNSVYGNNVADNDCGILLSYSSNYNSIYRNNLANNEDGIHLLYSSSHNSVYENNITTKYWYWNGILLFESSNYNRIYGNNIAKYHYGIRLESSSNNFIYHNNFVKNTDQVYTSNSVNVWDDGYPSGGNYWSDYTGVDLHSGPYQNETGSDGIGDTPYVIDANNRDHYPLMYPYRPRKAKWTVVAYFAGDNNLHEEMGAYLNLLKKVGATQDVNIVALIDNKTLNSIYYVKSESLLDITQEVMGSTSEFNMGDPALLSKLISYVALNYSAEHYLLIISNHGNVTHAPQIDENPQDGLSIIELGQALRTAGTKIDVLFMHACLMSTFELAYEVKDYVDILVASQDVVLMSFGAKYYMPPFDEILSALTSNSSMESKDLSSLIVNKFGAWPWNDNTYTWVAINETRLCNLIDAINNLSEKLEAKCDEYKQEIRNALSNVEYYPISELYQRSVNRTLDLLNFTQYIFDNIPDPEVRGAAGQLLYQFTEPERNPILFKATGSQHKYSNGLSVFFPGNITIYNRIKKLYQDTAFASATRWDEFLEQFYYSSTFTINVNDTTFSVNVFSNSTVLDFNFNKEEKQITFNITGPEGTTGYCNVTIPKALLKAEPYWNWTILLNGVNITQYATILENENYTFIYFTYIHTTKNVQIIGTWVVPEFSSAMILPIFMILTVLSAVFVKRKIPRKINS